jgi:hypothetical protein
MNVVVWFIQAKVLSPDGMGATSASRRDRRIMAPEGGRITRPIDRRPATLRRALPSGAQLVISDGHTRDT